ncbi:MAG: sulfatase [Phycisphaeraceae bacterium]
MVLISATLSHADEPKTQPNVIVFYADDLGWKDLSVYGSGFYETPHLDRLAEEGMLFTDAYSSSPVCSPARAALLTGQAPPRVGITDWIGGNDRQSKRNLSTQRNYMMMPAPQETELRDGTVTFADAFSEAGYATYFLGKWHVGDPEKGYGPTDHGFDVNVAGTVRGGPYGRGNYFHPFDMPNLDSQPGDHLADRMAEVAGELIRSTEDQPFMMFFSFYDVHTPLMTTPELREKYRAKREELGIEGPRFRPEPPRQDRRVQDHAVYAGMIETMDAAVGTVLASLEAQGLADDTIIIFSSDHGGLSTSEGSPTSNAPLRAGKGWMYEGGLRVPLIIRWPGVVEGGGVSNVPTIGTDLFPTMLEMAGLPARPEDHVDGRSIVPVLKGDDAIDREAIFWHYPHYGNQGGAPTSAVRIGDWKLIESFEDGRLELYNLADDLGEQKNLVDDQPSRAEAMHERLKAWRETVDAKYPTPNPDYDAELGRKDQQ